MICHILYIKCISINMSSFISAPNINALSLFIKLWALLCDFVSYECISRLSEFIPRFSGSHHHETYPCYPLEVVVGPCGPLNCSHIPLPLFIEGYWSPTLSYSLLGFYCLLSPYHFHSGPQNPSNPIPNITTFYT